MGPVYLNEYESRAEYYEDWLKEQLGPGDGLPDSAEEKHQMVLRYRQEAYQKLCDSVYQAKGYSRDAIPLKETLQKFDLLDEKAENLLKEYGTP